MRPTQYTSVHLHPRVLNSLARTPMVDPYYTSNYERLQLLICWETCDLVIHTNQTLQDLLINMSDLTIISSTVSQVPFLPLHAHAGLRPRPNRKLKLRTPTRTSYSCLSLHPFRPLRYVTIHPTVRIRTTMRSSRPSPPLPHLRLEEDLDLGSCSPTRIYGRGRSELW